jgi:hypothetical protein
MTPKVQLPLQCRDTIDALAQDKIALKSATTRQVRQLWLNVFDNGLFLRIHNYVSGLLNEVAIPIIKAENE